MATTLDPHATIGAIEISAFISVFFFGVVTVQVYLYYRQFPNDNKFLKAVVGFIWVFNLGLVSCIASGTYMATISFFGNSEKLIGTPNSLNASLIIGAFIDAVVQSIYIYRMYKVSRKLVVPILCWIILGALFVCALIVGGATFSATSVQAYQARYRVLLTSIFTGAATLDLIILVSLCYDLRQQRRKALDRTMKVVDLLIMWTIQTALITSIAAVVTMICFLSMRDNYAWIAIFMTMPSLFSNSLLALLNGRAELRNIMGRDSVFEMSIVSGTLEFRDEQPTTTRHVSIEVRQNKEV